jgi:hypothetical protein
MGGRTNVHGEKRSGWPSVAMILLKVLTKKKKFVKDGASNFRTFV